MTQLATTLAVLVIGVLIGLAAVRGLAPRLHRFGAHVRGVDKLPTLGHGFTHFTLDIRPLHVRVSALVPHAAEPGHVWLSLEEAQRAAIPVPVRKILAQL